jgi:hypothetical protein
MVRRALLEYILVYNVYVLGSASIISFVEYSCGKWLLALAILLPVGDSVIAVVLQENRQVRTLVC